MSNELSTIDLADLTKVNGGETTGGVTVRARGVEAGVNITNRRSNYEACLATNRQQARDAFPDTRNFWGWLTGERDGNARARIDYERGGMTNCLAALRGQ